MTKGRFCLFQSCSTKFGGIVSDILALKCAFFQKMFLISEIISYVQWLVCFSGVLSFFSLYLLSTYSWDNKFSLLFFSFEHFLFSVRLCLWWCFSFSFCISSFVIFSVPRYGSVFCANLKLYEFEEECFCFPMDVTAFITICLIGCKTLHE